MSEEIQNTISYNGFFLPQFAKIHGFQGTCSLDALLIIRGRCFIRRLSPPILLLREHPGNRVPGMEHPPDSYQYSDRRMSLLVAQSSPGL